MFLVEEQKPPAFSDDDDVIEEQMQTVSQPYNGRAGWRVRVRVTNEADDCGVYLAKCQ